MSGIKQGDVRERESESTTIVALKHTCRIACATSRSRHYGLVLASPRELLRSSTSNSTGAQLCVPLTPKFRLGLSGWQD